MEEQLNVMLQSLGYDQTEKNRMKLFNAMCTLTSEVLQLGAVFSLTLEGELDEQEPPDDIFYRLGRDNPKT